MEKPYIIHFSKIGAPEIGYLSIAENLINIPFETKRIFWIYGIPGSLEWGNHALRNGSQIFVAASGCVEVILESQTGELMSFELNSPSIGLYVPPMYWRKLQLKENSACLGLASMLDEPSDYIHQYSEFKTA